MATVGTVTTLPSHDVHGRSTVGIVCKVSDQHEFEAYRRLAYPYNTQNMGSTLARLIKALEFDFGSQSDLLNTLTSFKLAVEDNEKAANETLHDNIRPGIMIQKAPNALTNHILLSVPNERDQVDNDQESGSRLCVGTNGRWQEDPHQWTSAQCGSIKHQRRTQARTVKATDGRARAMTGQTSTTRTGAMARARVTRRRHPVDTAASAERQDRSNVIATPVYATW